MKKQRVTEEEFEKTQRQGTVLPRGRSIRGKHTGMEKSIIVQQKEAGKNRDRVNIPYLSLKCCRSDYKKIKKKINSKGRKMQRTGQKSGYDKLPLEAT